MTKDQFKQAILLRVLDSDFESLFMEGVVPIGEKVMSEVEWEKTSVEMHDMWRTFKKTVAKWAEEK